MSIPVPFDLPARHLQKFWGASGDFWQSQWDKFLDITGKKHQQQPILKPD